jgi:tRNA pseudouridine65 synthase
LRSATTPPDVLDTASLERDAPRLLHQDERLVAVFKPSGWLVHPTGLDPRESRVLLRWLRDRLGRRVFPVHRLDKPTSGPVLFALDPSAAAAVAADFAARRVAKRYLAVVRGHPPDTLTIDRPLSRIARTVAGPRDADKAARTEVRRLATSELPWPNDRHPTSRYALVACYPEGGRQHQIRRHLRHASYPLIGDTTYGHGLHNRLWRERLGVSRLLLTCCDLALRHPEGGSPLVLHALDPDFATLARRLGWEEALSCIDEPQEDGMLTAKIAALANAPALLPEDDA